MNHINKTSTASLFLKQQLPSLLIYDCADFFSFKEFKLLKNNPS